jgi:hypothetical protein
MLATLLDLQVFYFMPLPGCDDDVLKRNIMKCYNTAEAIIKLAKKLHETTSLFKHAPHFMFRFLLAASCVCVTVFMSTFGEVFVDDTTDTLIKDILAVLRGFRIQEGDLPMRCTNMMEKYWAVRHHLPRVEVSKLGISEYSHRLGCCLVFNCLHRWKRDVEQVQREGSNPPPQRNDPPRKLSPSTTILELPYPCLDEGVLTTYLRSRTSPGSGC